MNTLKSKSKIIFLILILIAVYPLSADEKIEVLATNSWTAAYVKMATAGSADYTVEQLAPSSMEHPPEYELKPSDVKNVRDADLLVYAGYEVLMKTVFDSFRKPEDKMVKIMTSYAPTVLEQSVLAIAQKLGTVSLAEENISEYKREIAYSRQRLKDSGLFGKPVLVHFHQQPLVQALGFEILGVFGPQPLEVRQIAELGRTEPFLIIDNAHNPMAAPLVEITGANLVELINFPGFPLQNGDPAPDTLSGVVRFNAEKLLNN
ncbi:MAG: zinc ABC transporter substrate-binding protein [Spirochaetales bacterium]|uniref:Zinc ABC transporter substrate-binding protein n=1 Tax=Candidatus Thalassospirochaeta sargassi TaxID=3119039 RepID=A0AAJ1IGA0_9SPIO|nr:zinc ABC transporter substrate-binding protein [Spirochaetales bacterium]